MTFILETPVRHIRPIRKQFHRSPVPDLILGSHLCLAGCSCKTGLPYVMTASCASCGVLWKRTWVSDVEKDSGLVSDTFPPFFKLKHLSQIRFTPKGEMLSSKILPAFLASRSEERKEKDETRKACLLIKRKPPWFTGLSAISVVGGLPQVLRKRIIRCHLLDPSAKPV